MFLNFCKIFAIHRDKKEFYRSSITRVIQVSKNTLDENCFQQKVGHLKIYGYGWSKRISMVAIIVPYDKYLCNDNQKYGKV